MPRFVVSFCFVVVFAEYVVQEKIFDWRIVLWIGRRVANALKPCVDIVRTLLLRSAPAFARQVFLNCRDCCRRNSYSASNDVAFLDPMKLRKQATVVDIILVKKHSSKAFFYAFYNVAQKSQRVRGVASVHVFAARKGVRHGRYSGLSSSAATRIHFRFQSFLSRDLFPPLLRSLFS